LAGDLAAQEAGLYAGTRECFSASEAIISTGLGAGAPFLGKAVANVLGRMRGGLNAVETPVRIHGNSLSATGPHDVYVIRDATTGRIYHFGETGRGFETRGAEWVRKLRNEHGLDTVVEHLRTVEGKAAAKALETRYIETYEKVFGMKTRLR
jgi:hypothetical protein